MKTIIRQQRFVNAILAGSPDRDLGHPSLPARAWLLAPSITEQTRAGCELAAVADSDDGCLAEEAVVCEPVSPANCVVSAKNTGNWLDSGADPVSDGQIVPMNWVASSQIPYETYQGILGARSG
jgi:hypothetical protein